MSVNRVEHIYFMPFISLLQKSVGVCLNRDKSVSIGYGIDGKNVTMEEIILLSGLLYTLEDS